MFIRTSAFILLMAALPVVLVGQQQAAPADETNPLLKPWTTPFGVPPFGEIRPEHFLPAIKAGIARQREEIEAIAKNPQPPTFANTLEAMENAGELLSTVSPVFSNMQSSNTTAQLQAINREVAPLLTALRDDIRLNPALFARVKALWDARESLKLPPVQARLLDEQYKSFVRGGANLSPAQKERFRAINARALEPRDQVRRQPPARHQHLQARHRAARRTCRACRPRSSRPAPTQPRRPAWRGSGCTRCRRRASGRSCSTPTAAACESRSWTPTRRATIAATRTTTRRLSPSRRRCGRSGHSCSGTASHADFVLEENMAKTPDKVYALLNQFWEPARAMAIREAADQQALIKASGGMFTLEAADWRYYPGEDQAAAIRPRRAGAAAVLQARQRPAGCLPRGEQALRPDGHAAAGPADVSPGGSGLRGEGGRRVARGHLLHGLPPASRQAGWSVEQRVPQHAHEGRQAGRARRRERVQLLAAGGRRAGAADARGGRDALPRVRPRAELAALQEPVPRPRRIPARLRRGAVADHGELGARTGGAARLREALQDG